MATILKKSLFIHIPKTAGQWVAGAIDAAGLIRSQVGPVHASPDELLGYGFHENIPKFTFVRHPLSWYTSMWAHRMDEKWEAIDDPEWFSPRWVRFWEEFTLGCQSNSFPEFIENVLRRFPGGFVSDLFDAYTEGCGWVGHQESLPDKLIEFLREFGENFEDASVLSTPPRNVRGRARWNRYAQYPRDLAQAITEAEHRAISKYHFERIPEGLGLI